LLPAETLYEQGTFHAGSGDSDGARALLQQTVALDPKLASAHEELGFLDYHDGRFVEARSQWQTAYALEPSLYRSLFATTITGTPFREQSPEERKQTVEQLRKIVHADLHFAPAYTQLAYLFWWQGIGRSHARGERGRAPGTLQPTGETGQPVDLTALEQWMAGSADTLWVGGGRFAMCKIATGRQALVAYRPTQPNRGDLLGFTCRRKPHRLQPLRSPPGKLRNFIDIAPLTQHHRNGTQIL